MVHRVMLTGIWAVLVGVGGLELGSTKNIQETNWRAHHLGPESESRVAGWRDGIAKRTNGDDYEMFTIEQLTTGALLSSEIVPERTDELLSKELKDALVIGISQRIRGAERSQWRTQVSVPDFRLEGFNAFGLSFIESQRSEGKFSVKVTEKDNYYDWYASDEDDDDDEEDYQVAISQQGIQTSVASSPKISSSRYGEPAAPTGVETLVKDLAASINALNPAYRQAIANFVDSQRSINSVREGKRRFWYKKLSTPTPSIYEFRRDWVCGQAEIQHVPIVAQDSAAQPLKRTDKRYNFRLPILFGRVHIVNPDIEKKLLGQKMFGVFGQLDLIVGHSQWVPVTIESDKLAIIGIDRSVATPGTIDRQVGAGTEFDQKYIQERLATASPSIGRLGCSQAHIISRDGYQNMCAHTGNALNRHYRTSISPSDAFALKCVGLYPDKTIVISTRHRDVISSGQTTSLSTETLVVANICQQGQWTEDIVLDPSKAPEVQKTCASTVYKEVPYNTFAQMVDAATYQRYIIKPAPPPNRLPLPPQIITRPLLGRHVASTQLISPHIVPTNRMDYAGSQQQVFPASPVRIASIPHNIRPAYPIKVLT